MLIKCLVITFTHILENEDNTENILKFFNSCLLPDV